MSTVALGQGRPIVFLHGDIGQAHVWRNVMPYAAQHGQAIGVDLIGMGGSAKLPASHDGAYSFDTHYRYLDQLLAQLGVTKDVVFVTQDWGANLTFEWAMNHPGAVTGVSYYEPATPPFDWDDWPSIIKPMFRALHSEQGEDLQLGGNVFVEAMPMGILRTLAPAEVDAYQMPLWATYRACLPPPICLAFPLEWSNAVPHPPASIPAPKSALLHLPEAPACMLLSVS